jgi:hypothetical protein
VFTTLAGWSNFYVIVGSSAGALTGLTFVTVTLVASIGEGQAGWGISAFTTPTDVHFGAVLLASAIFSAPWTSPELPAVALALCGVAGMAYSMLVVRRLRRPGNYQLVQEDWIWFGVLPVAAYTLLAVLAVVLPLWPVLVLFGIGGVLLLLLFMGIRNAWDIVTYLVVERARPPTSPTQLRESVPVPGNPGERKG